MSKPSDKAAGAHRTGSKGPSKNLRPPIVHAEFKDENSTSHEPLKGRGQKRTANADDRRNFRFILFALTLFIVIWIALELKQHHDAMTEFSQPTKDSVEIK
jgi:hypothetical protein